MKLVSKSQMNEIDAKASSKYMIPSVLLMEHAAHEVYLKLESKYSKDTSFVLVCGSGNNGGDGFALARLLYLKGYKCFIHFVGKETSLTKDAKINYDTCKALNIPFIYECDYKADIIIDCIFGTGLARNIEGKYKDIIEKINTSNKYVISIDIPSGIEADSGKVLGVAIKANETYTMQCGKIGLYIYPGRIYAGKVSVLDIFIPKILVEESNTKTNLITKEEMKAFLPLRNVHSNKGSYGRLLCVGGSKGMSGAITMAAKSALSAGCGLLTLAIPESIHTSVSSHLLESMHILLEEKDGFISENNKELLKEKIMAFDGVLIGCGIGRNKDIETILTMLLESDKTLIIDADALFAFKKVLRNRPNTIITPHLKEFATLLEVDVKEVVNNTVYYVDEFCRKYPDVTLVLKSETTIIAQNEIRYINTYGNNGLATGGSGDVLAGIIASLYVQNKETLKAAVLGVFLHAYSADMIIREKSVYSLIPTDLIFKVEEVLYLLSEDRL